VNVDGCRVGTGEDRTSGGGVGKLIGGKIGPVGLSEKLRSERPTGGRFPANLIHDGSEEVVGMFPETESHGGGTSAKLKGWDKPTGQRVSVPAYGERGSAARFFYCAKASKRDRDEGCEGMEAKKSDHRSETAAGIWADMNAAHRNHHPTVKPTDLMRYLCRLVTPPDGIVLDPFMGSGSTGKAAILEGFQFIGIDMTPEYVDIARARIEHAFKNKQNTLDL
jgi:site-specific DNA-methyltransferase (adenine-specific)